MSPAIKAAAGELIAANSIRRSAGRCRSGEGDFLDRILARYREPDCPCGDLQDEGEDNPDPEFATPRFAHGFWASLSSRSR